MLYRAFNICRKGGKSFGDTLGGEVGVDQAEFG
jgi:hypothetical protein